MNYVSRALAASLLLALTLAAGCGRSTRLPAPPPRAVKVEIVRTSTDAGFPVTGLVREQQRADLSFEVSGRITTIDVDVGDTVRRGQTLARLDLEPARLKQQQTRADVGAATVQLAERQTIYHQQQALFDDRVISAAALAAARAAYQSAVEQLASAGAAEALAARAVRNTAIVAPFDGRVVGRTVQPFVDVAAGQGVLQVEGQGRAQVIGMLPVTLAANLKPGALALAYRTDDPAHGVSIRLDSISSRIENGAWVEAIFRAAYPSAPLRSGETVLLKLPTNGPGLPSVPVTALLPATSGQQARVFVYDARSAKVMSRAVVAQTVTDGRVLLRQGVSNGEAVVVTGAQFLADGQAVCLFQPATQIGLE